MSRKNGAGAGATMPGRKRMSHCAGKAMPWAGQVLQAAGQTRR